MMDSLKIAYIAFIAYEAPIRSLYRDDPTFRDQSFAEQTQRILDLNLVYNDKFSYGMSHFGHHVDCYFFNLFSLQNAWARENLPNHQSAPDHETLLRILTAQIRSAGSTVVVLQGLDAYPPQTARIIKQECPAVRLVIAQTGWRFRDEQTQGVDVLILNAPLFLEQGRRCCPVVHLMYHSFDPRIAPSTDDGSYDHFFTFSGSSGYALSQHRRRYWTLLDLMLRADLHGWLNDPDVPWDQAAAADFTGRLNAIRANRDRLAAWLADLRGEQRPPPLPLLSLLPGQCHPPVYGAQMHRLMERSAVCLNVHTDLCDGGYVGNIRLFEATGMGACLLTDNGANLRDLFEPDHEVVTYSSIEECLEKVAYLRDHESVRRNIAMAGRRRTLASHTIVHRCAEINDIIGRLL